MEKETYSPLSNKKTREPFLEKIQILHEAMENVIEAHETWLEDSLDWTKKSEMSRLSRSWLDESLEEGKDALKNLKKYKIFQN